LWHSLQVCNLVVATAEGRMVWLNVSIPNEEPDAKRDQNLSDPLRSAVPA
jgi:hypothetical protein